MIFWEFENDGEEDEKLLDDIVVDVAGEVFDLRAVVVDNIWMGAIECRDEFGDVVDLSVIEDARLDLL